MRRITRRTDAGRDDEAGAARCSRTSSRAPRGIGCCTRYDDSSIIKLVVAALIANAAWRLGLDTSTHYRFSGLGAGRGDRQQPEPDARCASGAGAGGQYDAHLADEDLTIRPSAAAGSSTAQYVKPITILPGYDRSGRFTLAVESYAPAPEAVIPIQASQSEIRPGKVGAESVHGDSLVASSLAADDADRRGAAPGGCRSGTRRGRRWLRVLTGGAAILISTAPSRTPPRPDFFARGITRTSSLDPVAVSAINGL